MPSMTQTQFKGSSSGIFSNPDGEVTTGIGTNFFTWGVGINGSEPSNLRFTGGPFDVTVPTGFVFGSRQVDKSQLFSLGKLSYFNGTIRLGREVETTQVQLNVTTALTEPIGTNPETFNFQLDFINSRNIAGDPEASADSLFLPKTLPPVTLQSPSGSSVALELESFGTVSGGGFSSVDTFSVLEGETAEAELLGRFANPCESVTDGAVEILVDGPTITVTFTPNFGLTIDEAKELCGHTEFRWYQTITEQPDGSTVINGNTSNSSQIFFYSAQELIRATTSNTFIFQDTPQSPSLTLDQFLGFNTSLVGLNPNGTWDILYNLDWKSDYTGATNPNGGIFDVEQDLNPQDIPEDVRREMTADGATNASGTVSEPLPPIDFSGGRKGLTLNGTKIKDTLKGKGKNDVIRGKAGNDRLFGKGGNDRIFGGKGNDKISGNGGKDQLFGGDGNDNIKGNGGSDLLEGGKGRDKLTGGGGDDVLIGNEGNDILTGGGGKDTYRFDSLDDGIDTIKRFSTTSDLIDLEGIFASDTFSEIDVFARFNEFVKVESLGANTTISIDPDGEEGNSELIQLATLKNVLSDSISSSNFTIG